MCLLHFCCRLWGLCSPVHSLNKWDGAKGLWGESTVTVSDVFDEQNTSVMCHRSYLATVQRTTVTSCLLHSMEALVTEVYSTLPTIRLWEDLEPAKASMALIYDRLIAVPMALVLFHNSHCEKIAKDWLSFLYKLLLPLFIFVDFTPTSPFAALALCIHLLAE